MVSFLGRRLTVDTGQFQSIGVDSVYWECWWWSTRLASVLRGSMPVTSTDAGLVFNKVEEQSYIEPDEHMSSLALYIGLQMTAPVIL